MQPFERNQYRRFVLGSVAIFAFAYDANAGNVVYVNQTLAGGANNGTSWVNAYRGVGGLQTALTAAINGTEIWVAGGRYVPATDGTRSASFLLKTGVSMYGGFAGGETHIEQRDYEGNVTILSGDQLGNDPTITDNSYNVVDANLAIDTAILDGFTLTGGNANGAAMLDQVGAGMITLDGARPTIRNCRFTGNRVTFGGGAMYFRASSPLIQNCQFDNNNGGSFGGAFDVFSNSSPILTDCRFINNTAQRAGGVEVFGNCNPILTNCLFQGNVATVSSGFGGGMYLASGGSATMNNCRFIGNQARFGGGVYNQGVSPQYNNCEFVNNTLSLASGHGGGMYNNGANAQVRNCLFYDNAGSTGGAMMNVTGSAPQVINCTIVNNTATTGGGIVTNGASANVVSSILWFNSGAEVIDQGASISTVNFSTVHGGWVGPGANNSTVDPQFISTATDDYRIALGSPAADAGDPNLVPVPAASLDLDHHARILCGRVDMGAFETGLGDANCNDVVNVDDFSDLLDCLSGPGVPAGAACRMFDADGDTDVDWIDVASFQLAFTGS